MSDAEFDNQLVRQKDRIIDLIDNGKIPEAQAALNVVEEMWAAASYSYKFKELVTRLDRKKSRY